MADSFHFSDFAFAETSKVPCDVYPAGVGHRSTFVLSYPVNSPTSTLTLRLPKFGNQRQYDISTKVKRTMDGIARVTRKAGWPKQEHFKYTFEYVSATSRDDFLTFTQLTAGLNIRLLDQDNVNWQGVILDPNIKTEQRGPYCAFSLEFSFRGTKL